MVVLLYVCFGCWMEERQVNRVCGWRSKSSLGIECLVVSSIFPKGKACKMQMRVPTLTSGAGASIRTAPFLQTERKAKKWNDIFLPSSLLSLASLFSCKKFSVKISRSVSYPEMLLHSGEWSEGIHYVLTVFLKRTVLRINLNSNSSL
jgi:hypothetical protein